ncbi:TACC1 protein, partial [Prunella fulvescens]|nr:TACC1 protein [Prunella fulvescens]
MAFSAWQILSPVQWARWTWSAVRGGGSPEEEGDGGAGAAEEDDEEEDQEPPAGGSALGFRQVTRGPFPSLRVLPRRPHPRGAAGASSPHLSPYLSPSAPRSLPGCRGSRTARGWGPEDAAERRAGLAPRGIWGMLHVLGGPCCHFCSLREDTDPHDSFSWLLATWGSIMLTTSHQLSQDWETDPDKSALMQPWAGLGCEADPGDTAVDVGTATWQQAMPAGDTGTGLVELRAEALGQEQLGKGKTSSLGRKTDEATEETQLDPEQHDRSVSPFVAGACQLQSSAPAAPQRLPHAGELGGDPALETPGQVPKLGADCAEAKESVEAKPASPRRGSRIPASKLTPKRHRESPKRAAEDGDRGPTEPPPPRGSSQLGPTGWDSLSSLSGSSALQNSPVLPKGSYQFDPSNFDSMDPFKPTKSLASTDADSCSTADNSLNEILESQTLEMQEDALKGRDSPKKPKSRLITSGCKVKQHEAQPLVLDISAQDEGVLISEIPAITNRDGRATDEEKLASTTSTQKPAGLEKKAEAEDELEYFECSNVPVSTGKHRAEAGFEKEICKQMEKGGPGIFPDNPGLCSMDKCPSVGRSESPLAGICLSESEKAAVLTLIREEV